MRSLGADESALEAKLRVSAREAEQRWPLFRAMAPSKAEVTPALSDGDKQAWTPAPPPQQPARKPLLARPGISSKLSGGLEKFASLAGASPRPKKVASETAPIASEPTTNATRTKPRKSNAPTDAVAMPPLAANLFPSPDAPMPRETLFATQTKATERPAAVGLFAKMGAQETTPPDQTKQRQQPSTAQETAPDSLAALFDRIEGQVAPTNPMSRSKTSGNPLMRRIGKR